MQMASAFMRSTSGTHFQAGGSSWRVSGTPGLLSSWKGGAIGVSFQVVGIHIQNTVFSVPTVSFSVFLKNRLTGKDPDARKD